VLAALALAAPALAPAAGSAPTLNVFAAASLTEAFPRIDPAQHYSFGGSNQLALQIRNGAPADVFASASPKYTRDLFARRLVERPVALATNTLVVIVPRGNPAHIRSVYDLRRKGVKLVVAGAAVPVGAYTETVLARLRLTGVLAHVVSREPDVKGVVGKVALGQADAGIVYATDARPVAGKVRVVHIPASAQPSVRYEIAVVAASPRRAAARAWVQKVRSKAGRAVLRSAGFGVG
jgi:molybdate transport system substrate-binding protein